MTDQLRQAAQMALKALEATSSYDIPPTSQVRSSITTLKAVLEQQQADPDHWVIQKVDGKLRLNGKEINPGTIEVRLDGLTYRSAEKVEVRRVRA